MSDALFNAGRNKQAREQVENPLVEDGFKLIPSVTRVFSRSRDLYIYLQAYEREAEAMRPLAALVTIYRGAERVLRAPAHLVVEGLHPRSGAVPIRLTIALGDLVPGEYICQVTVLETAGQKAAFWQAPIAIVP
jgi:hypothetical protein